ncbi:enoyl-CoA hydratase/isomerase family protein, partial [Streptomyces sp. SID10244]|nr:enoyl-CoA hydratase/isomerase family protein [Streptomyces sp. SID10244]
MSDNMFNWEKDADGVVVLTMDDPNQGANTMNELFMTSLPGIVDRLEAEKDDITGVVLTSAKKTFFAGGDLKDMTAERTQSKEEIATAITERTNKMKKVMRRLETLGKPVVAAINGAALGGGLEIALHTHYRVAADVKGVQIGLPEATLGLLPGGGGVVRTVRLLGIQNALMGVLLQGTRFNPTKAKETGLVDEVVGSIEELIPAAK